MDAYWHLQSLLLSCVPAGILLVFWESKRRQFEREGLEMATKKTAAGDEENKRMVFAPFQNSNDYDVDNDNDKNRGDSSGNSSQDLDKGSDRYDIVEKRIENIEKFLLRTASDSSEGKGKGKGKGQTRIAERASEKAAERAAKKAKNT